MNKKSLLGLILFASLITTGLFVSAKFLISQSNKPDTNMDQANTAEEDNTKDSSTSIDISKEDTANGNDEKNINNQNDLAAVDIATEEPWLSANPSDIGAAVTGNPVEALITQDLKGTLGVVNTSEDTFSTSGSPNMAPQLIVNCSDVDYKAYIPEMIYDTELEAALDISNPSIGVDAEAAILFDAETKEVLFYKNPVQAVFPASTAKLLSSIVALNWCQEEEEVTIGDEVTMIASDSTRAYLSQGQILTIRNLLEGMLLPSGNDAAYAMAAFVGRKSLQRADAEKEEAVAEFIRLMNIEAKKLGVKNSCFKTPDGYDAIGQYTTAYDMGLIGIAATGYDTIVEISQKSSSRNTFVSGEDVTWNSTNKLIKRYSGQYYSSAIGLKTGTSTMAGRCIVAAAKSDGRKVVCVIMDSTSAGRWEDAITLLKYGLKG